MDVKNFEGDFCLESDRFYSVKTGREYKNPIDQLNKCTSQFRQLLRDLKLNFLVEASVIFINPEFTLYNAQMDHPIILPNQVNRFLKGINTSSSKLNEGHEELAKKLLSLHQTKSPFSQVPNNQYEELVKKIYCKYCNSFLVSLQNHNFICEKCRGHEKTEDAILRNVKELQLLFPERRITTTAIYEWCNVDLTKRTFCRVLKKNLTPIGKTSDCYYI
ncbi:nuclease-related domain-containing protein [Neobacillus niacini]|uniref:nuclease-related domain-containing protein n=1 Tax=Neobacillus niacini TaxID=86668 RepID=UPI0021AF4314|nr:nuclease-related domain-containing protein [Neobacillus niacini]